MRTDRISHSGFCYIRTRDIEVRLGNLIRSICIYLVVYLALPMARLKLKTELRTRKEIEKGKLSAVNEQSPIQALQKNIAYKNSNRVHIQVLSCHAFKRSTGILKN